MEEQNFSINPQNWLSKYGDSMYQYLLPRVNDSNEAQDILQDTFLSGLKGLSGYKGVASEKNWLFAIMKNKLIDYYRIKAKNQFIFQIPDLNSIDDEWFDIDGKWTTTKIPSTWESNISSFEKKEIQNIINICKENLNEMYKNVFVLKYLEGLESAEICKVLNISSSNYWVLLHRARLQMRECIEKSF